MHCRCPTNRKGLHVLHAQGDPAVGHLYSRNKPKLFHFIWQQTKPRPPLFAASFCLPLGGNKEKETGENTHTTDHRQTLGTQRLSSPPSPIHPPSRYLYTLRRDQSFDSIHLSESTEINGNISFSIWEICLRPSSAQGVGTSARNILLNSIIFNDRSINIIIFKENLYNYPLRSW